MGCALVLIGSATAGTPAVPAEADEAIVVQASPWASAAAEARVLADRILQRESDDLLLDGRRQRTLGHEIKQALSLIRRSVSGDGIDYGAGRARHGDASSRPGGPAARCRRRQRGTARASSAPPRTGHAAFDALNATLGLKAVQPFPTLDSVVLHLGERANIAAAIRAYRAIDGVAYAEPDARLGDSSDIEAARVQGRWHFVFRRAWGDCPSGCIDEELSFFTVAEGEAERIEPAQARGINAFAALLARRIWR